MITELTPEQEAQLDIYAQKWRDIGLSTEPANRPEAEKAVRMAYEFAGLKIPQRIVWFDSPMAMRITDAEVEEPDRIHQIMYIPFMDNYVDNRLFSPYTNPFSKIRQSFANISIWVTSLISAQINERIILSHKPFLMGQDHASWCGIIDYIWNVLDYPKIGSETLGVLHLSQNAGWWRCLENKCLLSERHNTLNLDDQDRPHCENGLAIGYPDGWGVYAWHGVRVPEWVIMRPQDITPDKIMSEPNAEVSRVMLERYGQDNFIHDGGFSKVQSDDYGDLYRIEFENGNEPIVVVKVKDASSDREYFLRVPPHIRSAHEGVAWSFGFDNPSDYNPDQEA